MVFYSFSWFFSAVAFLALIQQGTCIQCYTCKAGRDDPCGYPTRTNGAGIKTCSYSDDKCFHYDYNIDAEKPYEQFVERGCIRGIERECPRPVSDYYPRSECKICEAELCNNQGTLLKPAAGGNGNNTEGGGGGSSSIAPIFILTGLTFLMLLKNL